MEVGTCGRHSCPGGYCSCKLGYVPAFSYYYSFCFFFVCYRPVESVSSLGLRSWLSAWVACDPLRSSPTVHVCGHFDPLCRLCFLASKACSFLCSDILLRFCAIHSYSSCVFLIFSSICLSFMSVPCAVFPAIACYFVLLVCYCSALVVMRSAP